LFLLSALCKGGSCRQNLRKTGANLRSALIFLSAKAWRGRQQREPAPLRRPAKNAAALRTPARPKERIFCYFNILLKVFETGASIAWELR
jgi:hypothetical protein